MLKTVTVTNYRDESLELKMRNPAESGFYIKSIDGLGPAESNINVLDIVSMDGGKFNTSRASTRNIVITLGSYSFTSVEEARLLTYKYFPIKQKCKLQFETDNRKVYIYGYVEKNEPDIWSNRETFQISIICPQPWFSNIYENSITYTNDESEHYVNYEGEVETGLRFRIRCTGDVPDLKIIKGNETYTIDKTRLNRILSGGFKENDVIELSTIQGNKSLKLTRDGTDKNLLNAMTRDSSWFKIGKGQSSFKIEASSGLENMEVSIINPILYEGV